GQQRNQQQYEQLETNDQRNPPAGPRRHLRQLPGLECTAPAEEGDGGVDRKQRNQYEQADLRVEQAVMQIVVQALAVAQGARRAGDQYQTGGDAEHQVDAKQAARALQGQREAEQLVLQHQQCNEQEYRQKMQIGGDGVDHLGSFSVNSGKLKPGLAALQAACNKAQADAPQQHEGQKSQPQAVVAQPLQQPTQRQCNCQC